MKQSVQKYGQIVFILSKKFPPKIQSGNVFLFYLS